MTERKKGRKSGDRKSDYVSEGRKIYMCALAIQAGVKVRTWLGHNKGFTITGRLIGDHGTTPPLKEILDLVGAWVEKNAWSYEHIKLELLVVRCHIPARTFRGVRIIGYRPHNRTSLELLMRPEGSLRQFRGYLECGSNQTAFNLLYANRPEVVHYAFSHDGSENNPISSLSPKAVKDSLVKSYDTIASQADRRWRRLGKRQSIKQLSVLLLDKHPDGTLTKTDLIGHIRSAGIEVADSQINEVIGMLVVRGLIDCQANNGEHFQTSPVLDEYAIEWRLHLNRERQIRTEELLMERERELHTEKANLARIENRAREARERVCSIEEQAKGLRANLDAIREEQRLLAGE